MLSVKRVRIRIRMRTLEESSSQESSAHIVASNDDLLSELLLRLPIKSLLKFKSTSAPFTSLTFVDHPRGIEILQSCNGLFCCSSVDYNDSERKYYIYNPTTKQFHDPSSALWPFCQAGFGVNLAFDPSKSHTYKVVCVQRCKSSYDHSSLYFDLNEELVREMPMPPVPDDSNERGIRYFGESCGHLHLVEIYESSTTQFNVYEMERDHSGWFVKFRVDLNGVALAFPGIIEGYHEEYDYMYSFSVLCVVRREKEEDSFLALHIPGKVIGYNFSSKSYQTCDTDCPLAFGWSYAFQYIESLSPV
ncbi:hypothetical protein AAG906_040577 [Vitis piasezkii]